MTGVGGEPRTQSDFITDTRKRLVSLERQLSRQGAVDLSQRITEGKGISIVGTGSPADPMVISLIATPQLPTPLSQVPNSTGSTTITGTSWMNVTDMPGLSFGELPLALYVRASFSAQISGNASAYTMIGIEASGGLSLGPEYGDTWQGGTGTPRFGFAPYAYDTVSHRISGTKDFLLPAGAATTLRLRCKRNVDSGSNGITYPELQIAPIMWA